MYTKCLKTLFVIRGLKHPTLWAPRTTRILYEKRLMQITAKTKEWVRAFYFPLMLVDLRAFYLPLMLVDFRHSRKHQGYPATQCASLQYKAKHKKFVDSSRDRAVRQWLQHLYLLVCALRYSCTKPPSRSMFCRKLESVVRSGFRAWNVE